MATRKPDWAQRAVDKARLGIPTYMAVRTNYQDCPAEYEPKAVVLAIDYEEYAATLLRAHHRKVKRMVQKLNQDSAHLYINCDEISAYRLACEHIMDKLKELEQ